MSTDDAGEGVSMHGAEGVANSGADRGREAAGALPRADECLDGAALEEAMRAFAVGPPGVLRTVVLHDSYPGEGPEDPDAYKKIPSTVTDERTAIGDAIRAYVEAAS